MPYTDLAESYRKFYLSVALSWKKFCFAKVLWINCIRLIVKLQQKTRSVFSTTIRSHFKVKTVNWDYIGNPAHIHWRVLVELEYMFSSYFFCTLVCIVTPTIIKSSKSEVTVVDGNVLYLACEAEGFPAPSVTWKKSNKVLQTNINKTDFIIDEASEKDAGKYECEASNSVGTVSYTVEVTIKGKETRKIKNCFPTIFKVARKPVWKKRPKGQNAFFRVINLCNL